MTDTASLTYGQLRDALNAAIVATLDDDDSWVWVCDFSDTYVVYEVGGGEYLQDDYTLDGGAVKLAGSPTTVQPVTTYVPTEQEAALRASLEERGLSMTRSTSLRESRIEVRSEPATYRRDLPVSYFRDLALSDQDAAARDRLDRHSREMDTLRAASDDQARRILRAAGIEYRVTPGTTNQGQGAYFAAPLWLNEQFATAPRARRVLAALIPGFPLPAGVHSVSVPRLTTGTVEGQAADNSAGAEQDIVDAANSSTVAMINGFGDFPLQMLEQSPPGAHMDWAVFKDLAEAYDYDYEQQLIFGAGANSTTGTSGQLMGVTLVSGINGVTYTDNTPTLTAMYPNLGKCGAQIGNKRLHRPECWLMRSSRWFWVASSEDSQSRPITPPDTSPPPPPDGTGPQAVGSLAGRFPVYVDDAIPATYSGNGTTPGGGTQDIVIALRPSDLLALEGPQTTSVFREPLSGTVGVRFQLRGAVAALTGRYPTSISVLSGTGMAVAAGY